LIVCHIPDKDCYGDTYFNHNCDESFYEEAEIIKIYGSDSVQVDYLCFGSKYMHMEYNGSVYYPTMKLELICEQLVQSSGNIYFTVL